MEKQQNTLKYDIRAACQNGSCCLQFMSDGKRQIREDKKEEASMCLGTKTVAQSFSRQHNADML